MTEKTGPTDAENPEEQRQQEESSVYEKLVQKVGAGLQNLQTAIDADALRGIIDKSSLELKEVGEHSIDTIAKVTNSLKKDLSSTADSFKPVLDAAGEGAGKAADAIQTAGATVWRRLAVGADGTVITWRDKTGSALASLLNEVSGWSGSLGEGIDAALTYRTGEVTYGGSFVCKACGTKVTKKKPGHLPPCPKCHKTAFRRA